MSKFQHPPFALKRGEKIEAIPDIVQALRRNMPVVGFFMVDMSVEKIPGMGKDEILQFIHLDLDGPADAGMADVQGYSGAGLANEFFEELGPARPPRSEILQAKTYPEACRVTHEAGEPVQCAVPGKPFGGLSSEPEMDGHESAAELRYDSADLPEDLHGFIRFPVIFVAEIDPLECAMVANLEITQARDTPEEPRFFERIAGQILQSEGPVNSGKPMSCRDLSEDIGFGNKIAHCKRGWIHL